MSKQDVGEFEKFALHYFEYINDCQQKKLPTLLAKIFGVYKVVIKKKDTVVLERPVLIIENLFCERKIVNKYDLKGSERNRLVDTSTTGGQAGETVLLDENLIKGKFCFQKIPKILTLILHSASWTKPLYILPHSQIVLREAILRDTSFLEKNYVMVCKSFK
jgi:1-phosphatidylinositol-3-phosphate 5-kinase